MSKKHSTRMIERFWEGGLFRCYMTTHCWIAVSDILSPAHFEEDVSCGQSLKGLLKTKREKCNGIKSCIWILRCIGLFPPKTDRLHTCMHAHTCTHSHTLTHSADMN